jgi:hypothetical protein
LALLIEKLDAGLPVTETFMREIAAEHGVDYDYIFWHVFHYAVRDTTVRWLCRRSPLPVEVYGRDWEHDEFVAPYHKGYLPHGEKVAELYNSAKYALVTHPFELNSQRLAEACACGCIPIVYDCRHSSDQPHWDNDVQYFKTEKELQDLLTSSRAEPALGVGNHFSYLTLAQRILGIVYTELGWQES